MHETCTVETGITAKKPGVLDLEKYGSCQAGFRASQQPTQSQFYFDPIQLFLVRITSAATT